MDYRNNITSLKTTLIIALSLFIMSGLCGCFRYSFSGAGPSHIKTIAIPLFENSTAEYGVVEQITDDLILAFQQDNTLKIADENNADAVLWGRLKRVEDIPYTYGGEGETSSFSVGEYKLSLIVELEYYDLTKEEVIWKENVQGWGTYDHSTGSPEERNEGFQEAIDKLAEDILIMTVSGW